MVLAADGSELYRYVSKLSAMFLAASVWSLGSPGT
jgi:hypothetical protein